MSQPETNGSQNTAMERNIVKRRRKGTLWRSVFFSSLIVALVGLLLLMYNFTAGAFGYVAVEYKTDPATISAQPLDELDGPALIAILEGNLKKTVVRRLNREQPLTERSRNELQELVTNEVLEPEVVASWSLTDSLFNKATIDAEAAAEYPEAKLEFRSWLNGSFISTPMSSNPLAAGIRTALLGSLWMVGLTLLVAFPIGVGAAIYLEEYARDTWYNRLIQTNINNLAGVPSIIYGMLGLTIFVRALGPVTSGQVFGHDGDNGRTVISASLTMALLILPIMIINAQEALRAVPRSLRQASFGLGATRWQTIWHHVLPSAMPGILTGTILAMSRAIGETAPLIVVGASTYIVADPDGPFSKFTALPIQIYNWTSRPQAEFQHIAAAAIIALLIMLLSLNSIAVVLRNRFSRRAK